MDFLRSRFTIAEQVTAGPVILMVLLGMVLGTIFYSYTYDDHLEHTINEARIAAQPIVLLMRKSVGGGNYANVQDEAAFELYKSNGLLKFFSVEGKTDQSGEPFGFIYEAGDNRIVRTYYPANYESELKDKIERANAALANLPADHPRRLTVEQMVHEQRAALEQYGADDARAKALLDKYHRPDQKSLAEGYYLDQANWLIHLRLDVDNPGGGEVWLVVDGTELSQLGYESLMTFLPATVIALLVCGVFSVLMARSMTRPLKEMVATIEHIERNSDLTPRLPDRGRDEIARIAHSLNQMLGKFQGVLQEVNQSTERVSQSAQLMSTSLHESSAGITEEKDRARQLATAANEMLAVVEEVAKSATVAAESASDADHAAAEGSKEVQSTIKDIDALANAIEASAVVIAQLSKQAEGIGSVLDVIRGIADQTNLLALNAAIEAARAGEQGRGFSVVADEVRTLAQRTQNSTAEIHQMITQLQNGVSQAVTAVREGKRYSDACVTQAQQTAVALSRINQAVEQIRSMNEQIATSAEEQATVTDQINRNITEISEISNHNSDNACHCAQASEELARLATDLEKKVAVFRV
ncbi:MAG: methyl-accepting chemotaxis protein [Pseudomonadota bacterium]